MDYDSQSDAGGGDTPSMGFQSQVVSRAASTDPEAGPSGVSNGAGGAFDTATPRSAFDEDAEPQELSDLDPINSGAATPAAAPTDAPAKRSKALNFLKKKETKNIKGVVYTVLNDELVLDDDPRGEAKIDADGNLLGGRQYKLHTFSSPMRSNPNKLYMLSIDAARAAGFRDSLYFFRRNPLIHKLSCTQAEKDRLIDLGKLSGNLKSRAVTMVSARNCYKVMGATFVHNGKYVFDDYYEDKALAAGHQPGEPAWIETYDPEKDTGTLASAKGPAPAGATTSGLNQLLGHSGKPRPHQPDLQGGALRDINSAIGAGQFAIFGGVGHVPFAKAWDPVAKKAKPAAHLTEENWMLEYAKNVREANAQLAVTRKLNQVQVGLGRAEREEDMWIEVEEEEEPAPAPIPAPVPAQPAYPPPQAPPSALDGLASAAALLGPSTPQLDASMNPLLAAAVYAAPSPSPSPFTYSAPSPIPPPAPAPPPRKHKITKVYNPIRGFHDPETNVPHVYKSTQPSQCTVERVDLVPSIFDEDEIAGLSEDERRKKRRLEEAAGRVGVVTVSYVVDDRGTSAWEALIPPGGWDFGAGPLAA